MDFIFFNEKETIFFSAINETEARNKAINTFELQAWNELKRIEHLKYSNQFLIVGELATYKLKKFFKLVGGGEGKFIFSIN